MRRLLHIARFLRQEDGSLLVFFMISTITILGIVALSFDLGRRAATQTDMQGYVDNVVLAAAGELDGTSAAIANATRAANTAIAAANERLKAGRAGQDFTIALDRIVFYETLPDDDAPPSLDAAQLSDPASTSYKYRLPPSDLGTPPDPVRARYVGIRLATVDVPWIFAGVFSASDLPGEAVGAIAVAGLTRWTCDAAPLLFCLPADPVGGPAQVDRGQALRLTTAGEGDAWRPGDFGFVPAVIDPAGRCAGLTDEAGRQACLINVRTQIAQCFRPDRTAAQPGQRPFQERAAFNMAFDIFDDSMIQFFDDPLYAPGPHSIKGLVPNTSDDICAPRRTNAGARGTMAFPLDDCHASGCSGDAFGDGDWSDGRDRYVRTNYRLPGGPDPDVADGSFFDFPDAELTRYQYYLREIERARNGGIMDAYYSGSRYGPDNDGGRGTPAPEDPDDYTSWDDYWPDDFDRLNPIIPDALGRTDDNGLPQCHTNDALPPRSDRRLLLAGGIHCPGGDGAGDEGGGPAGDGGVTGFDTDVEIVDFYRLFQLAPVTDETDDPPRFELHVEVVDRLSAGDIGRNREVVQLFR